MCLSILYIPSPVMAACFCWFSCFSSSCCRWWPSQLECSSLVSLPPLESPALFPNDNGCSFTSSFCLFPLPFTTELKPPLWEDMEGGTDEVLIEGVVLEFPSDGWLLEEEPWILTGVVKETFWPCRKWKTWKKSQVSVGIKSNTFLVVSDFLGGFGRDLMLPRVL